MRAVGWALAAWLILLGVFAINGGPLFYFDTAGYFSAGDKMLYALGLIQPDGAGGAGGVSATQPDGAVAGNRSAVYALIAAILVNLNAV